MKLTNLEIPKTEPKNKYVELEAERIKSHNKECRKARQEAIKGTDDFGAGFMAATFCICHGQEDIVATNYHVKIERVYQSDNIDIVTEQSFTLFDPTHKELDLVHKNVLENKKIRGNVGKEIISEVRHVRL